MNVGTQRGSRLATIAEEVRSMMPGSALSSVIALAATFVSTLHGGPQILYAQFFSLGFNYLSRDPITRPGVEFFARDVPRFGVVLLGARIAANQLAGLGWTTVAVVLLAVVSKGHLPCP